MLFDQNDVDCSICAVGEHALNLFCSCALFCAIHSHFSVVCDLVLHNPDCLGDLSVHWFVFLVVGT